VDPAGHAAPQEPQLLGSVLVSVQICPHWVSGAQGETWHTLLTQADPAGQTMPHPPQSLGSLVRSWHVALPQQACPGAHGPHC
jgi:hypothetical protein